MKKTEMMKANDKIEAALRSALAPVAAIVLAMAVGCIVILAAGENPLYVYAILFRGALGGAEQLAGTLLQATPIIIAGIAATIGFRSGVFNIGVEGQLYIGGFLAALAGFAIRLPPGLHTVVCLLVSMLGGMLWIAVPAYFKARFGVNEVVPTILLNYVAVLVTSYFTIFVFKLPGGWSETPPIFPSAYLPRFFPFSRLNLGFLIALALAAGYRFYLDRTVGGYEMKAVGHTMKFAEYGGVSVRRKVLAGMMVSGMIAGLAGGIETLGVHRRFMEGFAPGFGSDGITAALGAGADPVGTVLMALFFGALRTGSLLMEIETNVSREIITVIQAVIILFITVRFTFKARGSRRGAK